jgi:hypothetical protein
MMDFSESVVAEEIDEILRRAVMRMEQQSIHTQELQAGPELSIAQVQLKQARATCATGSGPPARGFPE